MEKEKFNTHLIKKVSFLEELGHLNFDGGHVLYDLEYLKADEALLQHVKECCELQKQSSLQTCKTFIPNQNALAQVSPEALDPFLKDQIDRSDIRTHDLSNCIVFHTKDYENSVYSDEIIKKRKYIDDSIKKKITRLFSKEKNIQVDVSGQFLYPPGGYMGWHTNSRVQGWRLYINYAVDPMKSFFRYRDPGTGKIVTAWDQKWNFRLFKIAKDSHFWHSVYSETDRYSFGYKINNHKRPSFFSRVKRKFSSKNNIVSIR